MNRLFYLDSFPESILKALRIGFIAHINPHTQIYNANQEVYPTHDVGVVIHRDEGNELTPMKWGWKRFSNTGPLISARSVEAWESNIWRDALRERRCIIPVSGYFEWDKNQPKGKQDRYRINSTLEGGFALGGVYEINSKGEKFVSILTTAPNKKLATISDQMPVILDQDEYNDWFSSNDSVYLDRMMRPVQEDWIELVKDM